MRSSLVSTAAKLASKGADVASAGAYNPNLVSTSPKLLSIFFVKVSNVLKISLRVAVILLVEFSSSIDSGLTNFLAPLFISS
jgi:hypothetical protein